MSVTAVTPHPFPAPTDAALTEQPDHAGQTECGVLPHNHERLCIFTVRVGLYARAADTVRVLKQPTALADPGPAPLATPMLQDHLEHTHGQMRIGSQDKKRESGPALEVQGVEREVYLPLRRAVKPVCEGESHFVRHGLTPRLFNHTQFLPRLIPADASRSHNC